VNAYPNDPRAAFDMLRGQLALAAIDSGISWVDVSKRLHVDARRIQARSSVYRTTKSAPDSPYRDVHRRLGAYADRYFHPDDWLPCAERAFMEMSLPAIAAAAVDREYVRLDEVLYGD
jgi:hypothetical protein